MGTPRFYFIALLRFMASRAGVPTLLIFATQLGPLNSKTASLYLIYSGLPARAVLLCTSLFIIILPSLRNSQRYFRAPNQRELMRSFFLYTRPFQ